MREIASKLAVHSFGGRLDSKCGGLVVTGARLLIAVVDGGTVDRVVGGSLDDVTEGWLK
jgi:hypothetical protein